MRKFVILSFCVFSCLFVFGQDGKKVPIVVYEPHNFIGVVEDAFAISDAQDYFIISNTDCYLFSRQIETTRSGPRKPSKIIGGIDRLNRFRDVILTNDSVFFFALTYDYQYYRGWIGIKKNGVLTYMDDNGIVYNSLEALVIARFGCVQNFIDVYLNEYQRQFYNNGSNQHGLYNFSDTEAIELLRSSWITYYYVYQDEERTLDYFMDFLVASLPDVDVSTMRKELFEWNSRSEMAVKELFFERILLSPFIPLFNKDATIILKSILGEDNFSVMYKQYWLSYRNKFLVALIYLQQQYKHKIKLEYVPTSPTYDNLLINTVFVD